MLDKYLKVNWIDEDGYNSVKIPTKETFDSVLTSKSLNNENIAVINNNISPVTHYMKVNIRSKNLIVYPYSETTKTSNGVTFTNNGDGSITVSGTATAQSYFYFFRNKTIKAGAYALSGCPSGGGSNTYKILGVITALDSTKSYWGDYGNNGTTKTFTEDVTMDLRIQIESGQTVENLVFKPQLELGTTATPYTSYVPDLTAVKVIKLNGSDETVAEYTPTADGTVNGVTSIYPNTTFRTDTNGVIINCEYLNYRYTEELNYHISSMINNHGGGGGSITVDSELSDTSENPVQNKVINAALGNVSSALSAIVDGTV